MFKDILLMLLRQKGNGRFALRPSVPIFELIFYLVVGSVFTCFPVNGAGITPFTPPLSSAPDDMYIIHSVIECTLGLLDTVASL